MYVDEVMALADQGYKELQNNDYYKTKWKPHNQNLETSINNYKQNGGTKPTTTGANHFGNALAALAIIYQEMLNYDCEAPDVLLPPNA